MELIIQSVLAVALLAAYLILTLTGHDANLIAGILVGQMSALGIQKGVASSTGSTSGAGDTVQGS